MTLQVPQLGDGSITLLEREIQEIDYVPNTRVVATVRLRPNLLKHMIVHGQASITGPLPAAVATPNQDWPWAGIDRLTVYTPRGEILKTVSGRQMHFMNLFEGGTDEYSTFAPVDPEALEVHDFDLMIPFENKVGLEPEQTVFNSNEATEVYVSIEWNDYLNNGYDNAPQAFDMTVNLIFLEREPFSTSDKLEPRRKLVDQDFWVPITSDEMEYLLPENTLIKDIQLMFLAGVHTKDALRIALLEYLSIEDDDNAHWLRGWSGEQIRSANAQYFGIEPGQVLGLYFIAFDQLKDLTTLYKTFDVAYPKLVMRFDPTLIVSGETWMGIFIRQITTPPAIKRPL